MGQHVIAELLASGIASQVFPFSRKNGFDLLDYEKSLDLIQEQRPEVIVHCAAHVGGIAYNRLHPVEVFEDNVRIGLHLAKACHEGGVKWLINVMPNCVYPGDLDEYEETKWWEGPIHDSVLTYGLPRKMLWGACFAYCQKNPDFKPIHLIFPNMYGPGDHFDSVRSHAMGALISKVIDAKNKGEKSVEIWGTGQPIREWLYIKDGAMAIRKTLERLDKFQPNDIMNIGVTKGITILEMARLIQKIVGWEGDFILRPEMPDGAMKKILVADRMKSKLDWVPATDLSTGIRETVKWYLEK